MFLLFSVFRINKTVLFLLFQCSVNIRWAKGSDFLMDGWLFIALSDITRDRITVTKHFILTVWLYRLTLSLWSHRCCFAIAVCWITSVSFIIWHERALWAARQTQHPASLPGTAATFPVKNRNWGSGIPRRYWSRPWIKLESNVQTIHTVRHFLSAVVWIRNVDLLLNDWFERAVSQKHD